MSVPVKKTKIVCTIGPASWDKDVLYKMVQGGMNVARVNGAFADLAELERVEKLIRGVSDDVALMLDVKGHEVRLNKFAEPIKVKPGDIVEIGNSDAYPIYPITFPELYRDIPQGTLLIFDDGNLEAVVREKTGKGVMRCEVTYGEWFKPGKSINTPGIKLSNPALTSRDKEQIKFCAGRGWEFVAASFIRSRADAQAVVSQVKDSNMLVIAKVEDGDGLANFDEILAEVYGIMVARGDLGVELPFERLPLVQKELIWKCNIAGKPVITATQMLESMTESPRPTRAEISDVANAIIDGTDAIMLSGESSSGKYPAQAVATMTRIANEVEPNLPPELLEEEPDAPEVTAALCSAAYQVATHLQDEISAVVVVSTSGLTARLVSRLKLHQPIFAFVSNDTVRRQMALSRGITQAFKFVPAGSDRDKAIGRIMRQVIDNRLVHKDSKVLVVGVGLSKVSLDFFPNIFEVVSVQDFV